MLTFSFSSAAPSSLIFFSGVTSGELFSSVGNANGSDLPDDDMMLTRRMRMMIMMGMRRRRMRRRRRTVLWSH